VIHGWSDPWHVAPATSIVWAISACAEMPLAQVVQPLRGMARRDGWMRAREDLVLVGCERCGKTVPSTTILYTVDAMAVCPRCCMRDDAEARRAPRTSGSLIGAIGAVACALPILLPLAAPESSSVTIFCGVIAVGCGIASAISARARAHWGWLAISALIVGVGAWWTLSAP
jgi:hypothetical protein